MNILDELYQMTAIQGLIDSPGTLLMLSIGLLLLYLGIKKNYEPLLLVPIGHNLKKFVFLIFFLCVWIIPTHSTKAESSNQIKIPTIIDANVESPHYRWGRPIIVGLTEKGTEVVVYIDGEFSGIAKINESSTKTSNFYYQPVKSM